MKILALVSIGRSGSDFFQSLLDGHSQILQFPGRILFNKDFATILYGENTKKIVDLFCEKHPHFFDSRLNLIERHNKLGKNKNLFFKVNKEKFYKQFSIIHKPTNKNKINLIKDLNLAYYKAAGISTKSIRIMFLHLHLLENVKYFFKYFPKLKNMVFVVTLRDTLASLGSTLDKWPKYEDGTGLNTQTLYDNLFAHFKTLKELKKYKKKIFIIQLENLHKKNKIVMKEFCKIFHLKFKKSLKESTWFGKKWWGDAISLKYLNGVNPNFKNKFYDKYFFKKDLDIIEGKISHFLTNYNYPIRSELKKRKFLEIIPFKFEMIVWLNCIRKLKIKEVIKIPLFLSKRLFVLYEDNIYEKFKFPYSIGSKKSH
jgi:hypothetical protein